MRVTCYRACYSCGDGMQDPKKKRSVVHQKRARDQIVFDLIGQQSSGILLLCKPTITTKIVPWYQCCDYKVMLL